MNTDAMFPKDAAGATELLAALAVKDEDETICRYPTCYNPRVETAGAGRPSAYCENPEHTPVISHRARKTLKELASGAVPETTGKREQQPTNVVAVESLRSSVLQAMTQLHSGLERYISTLVEIADPDISSAQIQSIMDQANARIADAQQTISAERSLRLAAESASVAARQEAQAEREAAETAIEQMEAAEARTQRVLEETEQLVAQVRAERDETVERLTTEAQQQIEEAFRQAQQDVAQAEATMIAAQEEARRATVHAHDAEMDARIRIEAAEQLVREANATLERERAEVDRLRGERTTALADFRTQMETARKEAATVLQRERAEGDRLRGELGIVTTTAREQAVTYQEEMKRLREDLAASRRREDRLAERNDVLQTQLQEPNKPTS